MVAAQNTAQPRAVPFHHCAYQNSISSNSGLATASWRCVRFD